MNGTIAARDQRTIVHSKTKETTMSRSSIFAVAAIAALGAAVLAPATASAAQGPSLNPHQGPGPQGFAPKVQKGLIGHDKITWSPKNLSPKNPSPKPLIGNDPNTWSPKKKIVGGDPITWSPNWKHHHHHDHHWWFWYARYRQYHVVPVETVTKVVTTPVVEKVVGNNCNCLTKEYLQDGSVLFKDLCTKEAAMATPDELKAQAQAPTSQVR
jgi:hypothetical protein